MLFQKWLLHIAITFVSFHISLLETMDIQNYFFALEKMLIIKMQRASAIAAAAVFSECEGERKKRYVWIKPELQSQSSHNALNKQSRIGGPHIFNTFSDIFLHTWITLFGCFSYFNTGVGFTS